MPLFQVDTQKEQAGEYWTNRYILDAPDITTASSSGVEIIGHEQLFHTTNVMMVSSVVRPFPGPSGDQYMVTPRNLAGNYEGGALSSQLPLFNVVRVDLGVGIGRPSRKYYRAGLTEGMVAGPNIENTYLTLVDTTLEALRQFLAGTWVDPDGQEIFTVSPFVPIGMRQLRRGSKRRLEPVVPIA